jgi:hypothetical protein
MFTFYLLDLNTHISKFNIFKKFVGWCIVRDDDDDDDDVNVECFFLDLFIETAILLILGISIFAFPK